MFSFWPWKDISKKLIANKIPQSTSKIVQSLTNSIQSKLDRLDLFSKSQTPVENVSLCLWDWNMVIFLGQNQRRSERIATYPSKICQRIEENEQILNHLVDQIHLMSQHQAEYHHLVIDCYIYPVLLKVSLVTGQSFKKILSKKNLFRTHHGQILTNTDARGLYPSCLPQLQQQHNSIPPISTFQLIFRQKDRRKIDWRSWIMNFRISILQKQIQLNKYEQIDPSRNQVSVISRLLRVGGPRSTDRGLVSFEIPWLQNLEALT